MKSLLVLRCFFFKYGLKKGIGTLRAHSFTLPKCFKFAYPTYTARITPELQHVGYRLIDAALQMYPLKLS